jgi:hypothetical protein
MSSSHDPRLEGEQIRLIVSGFLGRYSELEQIVGSDYADERDLLLRG